MTGLKIESETCELTLKRGDFYIDDTDLQDEREILYANKGNFLESPTLGVGITRYSNSPIPKAELERIIRKEFEKDNINVVSVSVKQIDNDDFELNLKTSKKQ